MTGITIDSRIPGPGSRTGCDENNEQDRSFALKSTYEPHWQLCNVTSFLCRLEDQVVSKHRLLQSKSVDGWSSDHRFVVVV
jgi:hypothetical protein